MKSNFQGKIFFKVKNGQLSMCIILKEIKLGASIIDITLNGRRNEIKKGEFV